MKFFKQLSSFVIVLSLILASGNVVFAAKAVNNTTATVQLLSPDKASGTATINIDTSSKVTLKLSATVVNGTPSSSLWKYSTGVTMSRKSAIVNNEISTEFYYTPQQSGDNITIGYDAKRDGLTAEESIIITFVFNDIIVVNHAPIANGDSYSVNQNDELKIIAPGVLSNDSDEDHDSLSVSIDSDSTNGNLTLAQDGSFVYKPNLDFSGTDSFSYKVFDGKEYSNIATVNISVNVIKKDFVYLALGDSIAAGVSYEDSTSQKTIQSYTDKLAQDLVIQHNSENVVYYDKSVSGDNIIDLYGLVNSLTFESYISIADMITICIGANDIMDAAPSTGTGARDFYNVDWNKADDGLDQIELYWDDIITKIYTLNPDVELIVMNLYNPYSMNDIKSNVSVHPLYNSMNMHDIVDEYFYNHSVDMDGDGTIDYGLNYVIEHPEEVYGFSRSYEIVDVYSEFEKDTSKNTNIAFYDNYGYILFFRIPVQDPHPTAVGQELIYNLHKNKSYIH